MAERLRAGVAASESAGTAIPCPTGVPGEGCVLSAEVLRHRRALSSLHYLPGELEALSVVVEADGSSCCFEVVLFAGSNSVLGEVRLQVRRLGVLECWKVRLRKLFGSTLEQLDGGVRVEGDVLDRLAFSSSLKDAVFQVDRCLARDIMGMYRDVGLRVSVLYPANRADMMPFGAGDPDIALVAIDPPSGVTDWPSRTVRCLGRYLCGAPSPCRLQDLAR